MTRTRQARARFAWLLAISISCVATSAQHNTEDTNPVWSPDGRAILFYSYRDGTAQLYSVARDGSEERRLSQTSFFEMFPAFSGDGSQVVFVSDRDGERRFQQMEVYVMAAGDDATQARRLTHEGGRIIFPSFSSDGTQIAYTKTVGRFAAADIWVMAADGSGSRRLTDTPEAMDRAPRWSPDGRLIAFDSNRDGDVDIYVMNADGSNVRQVTNDPGYDALPSFSPDGRRLVFESSPDKAPNGMTPPEGADIYIVGLDGTARKRLTHRPEVYDGHASWSPGGEEVAFHTLRHGEYKEIYVMRVDGSGVRRLTYTNDRVSDANQEAQDR